MTTHVFAGRAEYAGGLSGAGRTAGAGIEAALTVPAALAGRGQGTNPEELLACSAAACFAITFSIVAQKRSLAVRRMTVESQCVIDSDPRLSLVRLVHRPRIELATPGDREHREQAELVCRIAEQACFVSAALRAGGVSVDLEPEVIGS